MKLKNLVEKYPVLTYFISVFTLTWAGILVIVQGPASSETADETTRIALVSIPMLLTPGITGIALTALLEGRPGLRKMVSRMTHWRVAGRWYAAALLVMPVLVLVLLLVLSRIVSPAFLPVLSLMGLAGIAAGFLEELGWTGFAVPRLSARWRPLMAGLVIGLLWGVWHGAADYSIRGNELGTFWPTTFTLFVIPLVAWRMLMTWVYENTQSLLLAQLMHFSYTGSLGLFVPSLTKTEDAFVYLLLALALWIGVGILLLNQRQAAGRLRPQLRTS